MKMKLALWGILLLCVSPAFAQNPQRGAITTVGNATCSTENSCVRMDALPVNGGGLGIQATGSFTGTLLIEATVDGTNYFPAPGCSGRSGSTIYITAPGSLVQCSTAGFSGFQVRGYDAVTGSAQIVMQAAAAVPASVGAATTRMIGALSMNPVGAPNEGLKVSLPPSSDPCNNLVATDTPVSQTASTKIVSGTPAMRIFICQIRIVAGAAEITSEWEGTGSACGTATIAHSGSTTAANGESFAANGGYTTTKTFVLLPGNDFCIAQSGSSRVSGKVSWVKAP